ASECCGSGCEPCVFDLYEDELERWEARVKRQWARWAQRQDPNP
ncbi:oxidoreductase-like domain-containing protein, partial [Aquisalimonas sp.]